MHSLQWIYYCGYNEIKWGVIPSSGGKTMKKIWIAIGLTFLLCSCNNQPEPELILPTRIHTPTQTATLVPTATPTALVLADHGDQTEPYPDLEVITAENVHRLEEVDVWGQGTVLGIALSPDATTIAVSMPTGIYFYDADTLEQIDWIDFAIAQIDTALMRPNWTYDNLDYSPDGKSLLVGFDDLYIVDLDTKMITQFEMTETEMNRPYVMETTYSKDGKHILVNRTSEHYGFREMMFEIYELKSNSAVFDYEFKLFDSSARIYLFEDHYAIIHQIMVDVNSGDIIEKEETILENAEEHTILFEQLQEDQWQVTLPTKDLTCNFIGKIIRGNMKDSSENLLTWILFNNNTDELNVLSFDSCRISEQYLTFPEAFGEFSISEDGNSVLSMNNWGNYQSLWDVHTGEAIAFQAIDYDAMTEEEMESTAAISIPSTSNINIAEIENYQLGNTGNYAVFYGQKEFFVWNLINDTPLNIKDEMEYGDINTLVFFPDDQLLLVREGPYGAGKIYIWDIKTEQSVCDFIPPRIISLGPQISPDGKFLAFLGYDGTIRIYGVRGEK
jgi:WD40 repeat protein